MLKNYKSDGYPASVRARFQLQVSALLARFLWKHGDCIRGACGSDWNVLSIVPSSAGRTGVHPLEHVVSMFPSLKARYQPLLAQGPGRAGHNLAADDAYMPTANVRGLRILLIDDTLTSGSRVQSAASALELAGATVVAAVPIGRVIRPEFSPESAALLAKAREQPFDFSRCCLET